MELATVDTFTVTGRGTARVVYVGDQLPELGEHVLLDGEEYRVTAVEWPVRRGYTSILVSSLT